MMLHCIRWYALHMHHLKQNHGDSLLNFDVIALSLVRVTLLSCSTEPPSKVSKQEQCRDSCRATLSKNGYSGYTTTIIPDPESSASLSSSAVSAMLTRREMDEHYNNYSLNTIVQDVKSSPSMENHLKNGVSMTSDDVVGNGDELLLKTLQSRPRRLPPLIDALVGTLDGDFDSLHYSQQQQQQGQQGYQRNIIRQMDKEDRAKLGEITEKGLKEMSFGEDPVAMVAAAAAAAALWSEQKGYGGSTPIRMKIVNDEWEEALRWISSWGNQQHNDPSTTILESSSSSTSSSSARQKTYTDIENNENEGVQRKHSRRKKQRNSTDKKLTNSNRFKDENEIDFELFYQVCIDRCVGDDGFKNRSQGRILGESFDIMVNQLSVRSTSGVVNQFFSILVSRLKIFGSMASAFKERTYVKAVWGLLGIMLSTAGVWLRNLIDRRKQTTCYHSLLEEEETNLTKASASSHRNRTNGTKKTGSKKKSRRKRRDNRTIQKQDQSNSTSRNFDEDSDISDTSFERMFVDDHYMKPSEDQGSKEGNTTVSTYTNDGADSDEAIDRVNLPTMNSSTKAKSQKGKNHNRTNLKLENRVPSNPNMRRGQNHYTQKLKIQNQSQDSNKAYENRKTYSLQSPVVAPTAEQREEAARKLKAFQQAQIQKMVNLSRRVAHNYEKESIVYAKVNKVPLTDIHNHEVRDSKIRETKLVPPPPGLSRITQLDDHKHNNERIQVENDTSLLLSHLLDEDDDVKPTDNSNEYTPERNNMFPSPTVQPVPLGDLLVSTFSPIDVSKNTSTTNPWRDESVDCSTVTTQVSSPSHTSMHNTNSLTSMSSDVLSSKDANFCLQVSAQEFSPSIKSNFGGDEVEERTKIW